MADLGPVHLSKGKIVGKRWKVVKKLGEGGCGAVYKVEDIQSSTNPPEVAALKAESNFVAGGSVLKLEVQILRRLQNHAHVARVLHSGKKQMYCYMVMTLLGESLNHLKRKIGRTTTISTQARIGINILFGIKQIHDVGFVHRDLKPANVAIGRPDTPEARFLHILDFGLAREFLIKGDDGKPRMRRARQRALFRGTTRYCSVNTHDRQEQGRVDDLWSLLYMLAELRGSLPWGATRSKLEVAEIKKAVPNEILLENSPIELVNFATHLSTLNYYSRPDYAFLFSLFEKIMKTGQFKFTDPWDWEKKNVNGVSCSKEVTEIEKPSKESKESTSSDMPSVNINVPLPVTGAPSVFRETEYDDENPFPAQEFSKNTLGF